MFRTQPDGAPYNNPYLRALQAMVVVLAPARLRSSSWFQWLCQYLFFKIFTTCINIWYPVVHSVIMPTNLLNASWLKCAQWDRTGHSYTLYP